MSYDPNYGVVLPERQLAWMLVMDLHRLGIRAEIRGLSVAHQPLDTPAYRDLMSWYNVLAAGVYAGARVYGPALAGGGKVLVQR